MNGWGCEGVSLTFGRRTALTEVSLSLQPGRITAVVGGDGAGKSTLLRVVVGVLAPNAGSVTRPDRTDIGFLAGQNAVYDDLTVDQNLDFVARAYNLAGPDYVARRSDLLARTGLATARDRLGAQLSGGMRQKLGVALALLSKPALVVLDEPTTGVDPLSRLELARLIAHAAAEGAAVLLSTTYMSEAERADDIVVLDGGRVLLAGTPRELTASVPGVVWSQSDRPRDLVTWRRESGWHYWTQADAGDAAAQRVTPDLEDAVLVAAVRAGATS